MSMMRNARGTIFRLFLAGGLAAAASACESDKAQPVFAQDFYARHTSAVAPISPLDRPGIIPLPDAHTQAPAAPPRSNDSGTEPTASDFSPLPPVSPPTTGPSVSFASPTTQLGGQPSIAPINT